MLLKCSECSETWNKAIKFFSPIWPPPPWHPTWMLTTTTCSHLSEGIKKCSDEFPISYRIHFTTCTSFLANKFFLGGGGGNSTKIINLIFEPFPKLKMNLVCTYNWTYKILQALICANTPISAPKWNLAYHQPPYQHFDF